MLNKINVFKLLLISLIITSCTKPGEDNDKSASNQPGSGSKSAFQTNCGTIVGGKMQNPPSPSDGFSSPIRVLGSNLVSVTLSTGPLLVKLHGLGSLSDPTRAAAARAELEALAARGNGIFIPADSECSSALGNSSTGALGQIFTSTGTSFSETLVTKGLATITSDPCGGSELVTCYRALSDEARKKFAGELTRLLWKPVSDSNGKLAIHTGPFGTSVKVNGELGTNQGGGNGYGSLARFSKPGCGYGANISVEVTNTEGAAYTFKGSTTITIPSGCQRFCLENGNLEACAKR
jgi:hypothetical protein